MAHSFAVESGTTSFAFVYDSRQTRFRRQARGAGFAGSGALLPPGLSPLACSFRHNPVHGPVCKLGYP